MAIPVATTTITILRVPADPARDPYDPQPDPATVATGIRAHISTSTGRETVEGGSQSITSLRLACDPFAGELHHLDRIRDEQSGRDYEVVWEERRYQFGLDHYTAGIERVSGVV